MTDDLKELQLIEQQKAHFNSIADKYKEARLDPNHLLIKQLIWHHCLKNLPLSKVKKYHVLEAMCGYGEGGTLIQEHMDIEIEYEGFDYSDVVIENMKIQHPDLAIRQADATRYVPEADSYDIIILIGGLHHVPNHAAKVVENLSRGLKKDGLFINFEPTYANPFNQWVRQKIYQRNTLFDEETERDFSVNELKEFFENAALSPLRLRYPGLLSYILFYNPDAFPFLNFGGRWLVKFTFFIDRLFYANRVGAWFSFTTLSIWQKKHR